MASFPADAEKFEFAFPQSPGNLPVILPYQPVKISDEQGGCLVVNTPHAYNQLLNTSINKGPAQSDNALTVPDFPQAHLTGTECCQFGFERLVKNLVGLEQFEFLGFRASRKHE